MTNKTNNQEKKNNKKMAKGDLAMRLKKIRKLTGCTHLIAHVGIERRGIKILGFYNPRYYRKGYDEDEELQTITPNDIKAKLNNKMRWRKRAELSYIG